MRIIITICVFLCAIQTLLSQIPELLSYQAVARTPTGQPIQSTAVSTRFRIHDLSASGPMLWEEFQSVVTNEFGLFNLQLGSVISLDSINWDSGPKFLATAIDFGEGFIETGTQQMLSVPFAIRSGNGIRNISSTGDTLFMSNGDFILIPGISDANFGGSGGSGGTTTTGTTLHTCGTMHVHNQNLNYGTMTDQEGNVYKTVVIGAQEWMAENLNTSIYRNGEPIATNLPQSEWFQDTIGSWLYYNNDLSYECPYGKLYNWYAVVNENNLCPSGWHVPTDAELNTLVTFFDPNGMGYPNNAGGPLKSTGTFQTATVLWQLPNTGAANSSGFSAIPGGQKNPNGGFAYIGQYFNIWTSTEWDINSVDAWMRWMYFDSNSAGHLRMDKNYGYSVRCIRD
jgi:uncharacterized protein (TIGR02145 family)